MPFSANEHRILIADDDTSIRFSLVNSSGKKVLSLILPGQAPMRLRA